VTFDLSHQGTSKCQVCSSDLSSNDVCAMNILDTCYPRLVSKVSTLGHSQIRQWNSYHCHRQGNQLKMSVISISKIGQGISSRFELTKFMMIWTDIFPSFLISIYVLSSSDNVLGTSPADDGGPSIIGNSYHDRYLRLGNLDLVSTYFSQNGSGAWLRRHQMLLTRQVLRRICVGDFDTNG